MRKLIYTAITSLDGYIEDRQGSFGWAEPREDLHRYINKLEASCTLMLYGRKLYQTMSIWDSDDFVMGQPEVILEYARIWRAAEKIVYSRTLSEVDTGRTSLRSEFDPVEVRRLKADGTGDIGIGGAGLAGAALAHRLVDEINLFVFPVVVGGGKPSFKPEISANLTLLSTRTFDGGVVQLQYSL